LEFLQAMEANLKADTERLARMMQDLDSGGLKLEEVKPLMDEAESMLRAVHHQAERLEIERDSEPRIAPFDGDREAIVVRPDEKSRKLAFAGLAGLAGFCLVGLAIGFVEMQFRRLGAAQEVTDQLGLPILGALPFCKGGAGKAAQARQTM